MTDEKQTIAPERNLLGSMKESQKYSSTSKILGFISTLFLIPFLFVGTCIPAGLIIMLGPFSPWAVKIAFFLYGVVFLWFIARRAMRTTNTGSILAMIIAGLAIAISGIIVLSNM